MNYVLSIICGIFAMFCILLTSCERGNENFFFKEGGKERLSEREDFKDFPRQVIYVLIWIYPKKKFGTFLIRGAFKFIQILK